MRKILTFLVCFTILLSGCREDEQTKVINNSSEHLERNFRKEQKYSFLAKLNQSELDYVQRLRDKGGLSIATRHHEIIYEIDENGDVRGLHYELFLQFAEQMKVPIKFNVVTFQDYFKYNGKVPEDMQRAEYEGHEPDIFTKNDFIMDSLTVLPWREKLMQFVRIFPTKIVLITRKGEEIGALEQLQGKRVATVFETSYYTNFTDLDKKHGLDLKMVLVKDSRKMAGMVERGEADVTSRDANRAIVQLKSYPGLTVAMPVTNSQQLGWAVSKKDPILYNLLSKFVKYSKDNRIFHKLWVKYFGISYSEYLQLIDHQ